MPPYLSRNPVRIAGLKFYLIGDDPAELMSYMVTCFPNIQSLATGKIQRKRYMVCEVLQNRWSSRLETNPLTHEPSMADTILTNPPSFPYFHWARALGILVHLMFTMPWSSTTAFHHALANFKNVGGNRGVANYVSFNVVGWLTWRGQRKTAPDLDLLLTQ